MTKFAPLLTLLAAIAFPANDAFAQGLLGKIKKGAGQAVDAVGGAAENVGQSIDLALELVSNDDPPQVKRDKLDAMAATSLSRLFAQDPLASDLFDASVGYAVFDTRKLGALGVSAGFGRGVAVSRITPERTYMTMGTGGVGLSLGIGGFESQIVILFETAEGFNAFVVDGYDATAEAGSMFGEDKESETAQFVDGRTIFVLSKKGWKVSATAAGTKYWTDAALN